MDDEPEIDDPRERPQTSPQCFVPKPSERYFPVRIVHGTVGLFAG
jgi:hypothetical protein